MSLAGLRWRLTAWYAATLGFILVVLGVGLFLVIRGQIAHQLDIALEGAARELMRAAATRELEAIAASGQVVDAIDELRIPDRMLFLYDSAGQLIKPSREVPEITRIVAQAGWSPIWVELHEGREEMRLLAERFRTPSGRSYIAVAVADQRELENEYAALIAAFVGAALVALVLFSGGGYVLVRQATAPVERTMEYMRRFMADAAHELRTPLTVLRTRAEVTLQRRREPAEYAAALGAIERESGRLSRLVEDLLLLTRADAGERPLQRARVFLDDLVLDVAGGAGVLAERNGVDLDLLQVGEAEVEGDPVLLRQLISNVVDNAVKFTPRGGTVRVGVARNGSDARVTVEDTGPGIAPEQVPHIFERFFRGDPARTRAEGVGLGLAIARWIADEHGARIEVASQVGRGTRIDVLFPNALSSS